VQCKARLQLQNAKHCLFDDDNPEEAKQEITYAAHYCLHLLQEGKYITDHVTVLNHAQRKWQVKQKKLST
jgi:hypothetical protein